MTPLLIILISHNHKANKTDGIQTLGNKTLIFFFLSAQLEAIRAGHSWRTSLTLKLQRSRGSMNPYSAYNGVFTSPALHSRQRLSDDFLILCTWPLSLRTHVRQEWNRIQMIYPDWARRRVCVTSHQAQNRQPSLMLRGK